MKNWIQKYQEGNKFLNYIAPSRQDSLDLLNNSNAIRKFYASYFQWPGRFRSAEDIKKDNEWARNDIKERIKKEPITAFVFRDSSIEPKDEKITYDEYYKKVDDNKYYQREIFNSVLDLRAPMTLYDERISPKGILEGENTSKGPMAGDLISIYEYPALQVTPIDLLTPAQRKRRQNTYGINPGETDYRNWKDFPKIKPRGIIEMSTKKLDKIPMTAPQRNLFKDLKMRSLWANSVKANPETKIGTLNPLEYNDESKGFTINEAINFPQEVKDKYNIDYIFNKINKKQEGGILKPRKINWYNTLNFKKWDLNDYTEAPNFNTAFKTARNAGEKEFVWKDNRYTTELVDKKISDNYHDSKAFLNKYYSEENYKPMSFLDSINARSAYIKDKFGASWLDKYQELTPKLDSLEKVGNYREANRLYNNLDSILAEEQAPLSTEIIKKYLPRPEIQNLNNPSYFSITNKPIIETDNSITSGFYSPKNNQIFISGDINEKVDTTPIHELSHKADLNDVNLRTPEINVDVINKNRDKFNYSNQFYQYMSKPTEIEARKMSLLYTLYKGNHPYKNISENTLDSLYNVKNTLPDDVGQVLDLYQFQKNDFLKYLNNDFSYIKKQKGGIIKAQKGTNFMTQWTSSPMHLSMLKQSAPNNYKDILKGRLENLAGTNIQYVDTGEENPYVKGSSDPSTGKVTIFTKNPELQQGLITHEVSHSSDRPIKNFNWKLQNFRYNLGIDKELKRNRVIPDSDISLINKYKPYNFEELPDKDEIKNRMENIGSFTENDKKSQYMVRNVDYISDPTETRARLNDLRQRAYNLKIYNPFIEKINPQQFKSLLSNPKIDQGTFPLFDLKSIYSDDEIFNMLNLISENKIKSSSTILKAQKGIKIKEKAGKGKVNPNTFYARQAYKESTFNPNAKSPVGAKGLTQIMPNAYNDYKKSTGKKGNLTNPAFAVQVQKWVMGDLLNSSFLNKPNQNDSVHWGKSAAAYNWGRGNMFDYLTTQKRKGIDIYNSWDWVGGLPQETKDYVNTVLRKKNPQFEKDFMKVQKHPYMKFYK